MRLLITRPHEDAQALSDALRAAGHEPLIEPLLTIRTKQAPKPEADRWQAILATSANGMRALSAQAWFSDFVGLPLLAVGPATAESARATGFNRVEQAGGDVASLATLVTAFCEPGKGALLHVAGTAVAGDLKGDLEARGFAVVRATLYEAETATTLSETARAVLADGKLDAVLLYSPRTARTFADIISAMYLTGAIATVSAYCLSAAVAEAVAHLPWRQVHVAAKPEQDALLALLDAP